jgi:predicted DNA-binding transcriptional regulator AlpA
LVADGLTVGAAFTNEVMHMSTTVSTEQNCARSGLQPLLTVVDLERLFRMTSRNIRKLWEAGKFPRPFKVGGSNRWRPEDVEEAIERFASVR